MSLDRLGAELEAAIPDAEVSDEEQLEAEHAAIRAEAERFLWGEDRGRPLEEIQAKFAESFETWWLFFLPHIRTDDEGNETESAPFQRELMAEIQDLILNGRPGAKFSAAYPREHAKSIYGCFAGNMWALLNGHRHFSVIFSNTEPQAHGFLADIRDEIETNERLQAIYPVACTWDAKRQPTNSRLILGNGGILMAAGKGKSVRGMRVGKRRPDLIFIDDIENDKEVENPRVRKKTSRWFNRSVRKLGKAAVYVILGTILHAEAFLAQQIKDKDCIHSALVEEPANMELWAEWEEIFHSRELKDSEAAARNFYDERRALMDEGAVVLWPGMFDLYGLMVERAEDLASFLSERQNNPFDPSASWFPEDRTTWLNVETRPPDTDVIFSVAFWDPSRGTSKGDTSSLVRLDCYKDGRRHVRESETDRVVPEIIMETGIGMHKRRPFNVWGVEKVGLSSYEETLRDKGLAQGLALPVVPHTPTGSKDLRIKSMRPLTVSGTLTFDESLPLEAQRQIKFYPQHPNDDFPDAVEAANKIADEYLRDPEGASGSKDPEPDETRINRNEVFGGSFQEDSPLPPHRLEQRVGWASGMRG